jgi:hypothetical protein
MVSFPREKKNCPFSSEPSSSLGSTSRSSLELDGWFPKFPVDPRGRLPKDSYRRNDTPDSSYTEKHLPSGLSIAARMTRRPIRPNPLIPMLVGMMIGGVSLKIQGKNVNNKIYDSDMRTRNREATYGRGITKKSLLTNVIDALHYCPFVEN